MRIDGPAAILHALLAAPAAKVAEADPAPLAPAASAATTQSAPPAAPLPSVAMLVTLAAVDPADRRRHAAAQADTGLGELTALRSDLVQGTIGPQRLRSLRDWARRRIRPDDPELAAIMDEIELRILVELAKQDREDSALP